MRSATRVRPRRVSVPLVAAMACLAVTATTVPSAAAARSEDCTSTADRAGDRGFLLDEGTYVGFDAPDPTVTIFPVGINGAGEITGEYMRPASESGLFRDAQGCITSFDVRGARGTEALDNNDRGEIVVHYSTDTPIVNDSTDPRTAVLFKGQITPIKFDRAQVTLGVGINNSGQVVGAYGTPGTDGHGFLWDRGQFTPIEFPKAMITEAHGINDLGQVVGLYTLDGKTVHGFLWDRGKFTSFDAGSAPVTNPFGIDNSGRIVGYTLTGTVPPVVAHGFVMRAGATGPATPIDFPNSLSTVANGIRDDGRIVGSYTSSTAPPATTRTLGRAGAPYGSPLLLWRPPG